MAGGGTATGHASCAAAAGAEVAEAGRSPLTLVSPGFAGCADPVDLDDNGVSEHGYCGYLKLADDRPEYAERREFQPAACGRE
jgi:hypothetical protein